MVTFSVEDEAFRVDVRAWLNKVYPEFVRNLAPQPYNRHDLNTRRAWENQVCRAGWSALTWPEQYGGKELPLSRLVVFLQEYARADCPMPANGIGHGILGPTLLHYGTEEQKCRFLPPLARNEEVWCQGYSEPGAGSDLAGIRTRARREGDEYVLNGHKIWTSGAHISDWCFVLARTDEQAQRHRGISFLLVDMKSPGVRVEPIRQITGEADFCEVFFENVRVPVANCVGEENDGWRVAMGAANFERGTYYVPHQVRIVEDLKKLSRLCSKALRGASDGVTHLWRDRLAQLAVDVHGLRLVSERTLEQTLSGQPPGPESSYAKLLWSETQQRLYDYAIELLGEHARMGPDGDLQRDETHWMRQYLWSRNMTIAAGTSEIHRNIIAERTLGLPR